jgi:hypothetical protein
MAAPSPAATHEMSLVRKWRISMVLTSQLRERNLDALTQLATTIILTALVFPSRLLHLLLGLQSLPLVDTLLLPSSARTDDEDLTGVGDDD